MDGVDVVDVVDAVDMGSMSSNLIFAIYSSIMPSYDRSRSLAMAWNAGNHRLQTSRRGRGRVGVGDGAAGAGAGVFSGDS